MTRNQLHRSIDDPQWSGRFVEGSDGGWTYDDQNLLHMRAHLIDALTLLIDLRPLETTPEEHENHSVLPMEAILKATTLFETIADLQRYLPWVEGWCCVSVNIEGGVDVKSAHVKREQAHEWLKWWDPRKADDPHKRSHFEVRYWPAPILAFRHPDAKPGDPRWQ